jgi:hypothetical protein
MKLEVILLIGALGGGEFRNEKTLVYAEVLLGFL